MDVADDDDQCVNLDADECGKGNFDDGYTAAQEEADEQAAQLYTAIGILGGIMGILVLTVLGGAYYIYSSKKGADFQHQPVPSAIIDVDGGATRNHGHHMRIESHSHHYSADSTPMLDTM